MSESTSTYQGYKNFETFSVSLMLQNERADYERFRSLALWCLSAEGQAEIGEECGGVWDEGMERARFALADKIKEYVEDNNPLADAPSIYGDLISCALERVSWEEVADDFLKD